MARGTGLLGVHGIFTSFFFFSGCKGGSTGICQGLWRRKGVKRGCRPAPPSPPFLTTYTILSTFAVLQSVLELGNSYLVCPGGTSTENAFSILHLNVYIMLPLLVFVCMG